MNKWVELLLGLILVVGMILVAFYSAEYNWAVAGKSLNLWHAGWEFLKGGIFWAVVMVGALFILLGISDIKG